jgi:hypothetical protein
MDRDTQSCVSTTGIFLLGGVVPFLASPAMFAAAWWTWGCIEGHAGSLGHDMGGVFGTLLVAPVVGFVAAIFSLTHLLKNKPESKGYVFFAGMLRVVELCRVDGVTSPQSPIEP